jgi:hypothetical protein
VALGVNVEVDKGEGHSGDQREVFHFFLGERQR